MKKSLFCSAFFLLLIFSCSIAPAQSAKPAKAELQYITIITDGRCGMCKTNIEAAVRAVKGVKSAKFNGEKHEVTVTFRPDKTNGGAIRQVISKAGYSADDVPADVAAKAKLPNCCK